MGAAGFGLLLLGLGSPLYMAWQMKPNLPKMAVVRFVWPLCALFPGPRLIRFIPKARASSSGRTALTFVAVAF